VQGNDGNFYGMTSLTNGDIFQITPTCESKIIHSFTEFYDGAFPEYSSLVRGSDGNFYGMTKMGGTNNMGTIFKITSEGDETILHSFRNATDDGASPYNSLIQGTDGNFYGMTYGGGLVGGGTVFKVTSTGAVTILSSFTSTVDTGDRPTGNLIEASDGNFYGMTPQGGTHLKGLIFKITPNGVMTQLWSFGSDGDGAGPYGSLIQGHDGNLYGLTAYGGIDDKGTIFKITLSGEETVLHSFGHDVNDGAVPYGSLLEGSDGYFYGMTNSGGTNNLGIVFKFK
jgi:uncharacterized repeat protein (TIGR03803 family)